MSIAKSEFIVGGKYRLMRKIGSGSFGDIYLGINISNGEVRHPPVDLHDLLLDCCLPARFPLLAFPVSSRLIPSHDRVFPSFAPTLVRRDQIRRDGTAVRETAPRHVDRDVDGRSRLRQDSPQPTVWGRDRVSFALRARPTIIPGREARRE